MKCFFEASDDSKQLGFKVLPNKALVALAKSTMCPLTLCNCNNTNTNTNTSQGSKNGPAKPKSKSKPRQASAKNVSF
ncbi:hypothetical protein HYC85_012798 [Camellia sinensis]|uniref:Uncharacterized protein n=1 Tax=Camellia sinensis TaxID=4442 RepID=A0A7J7HDT6_CAMSI|nr:hypothetical protein HYC85_012798 [Camellia sinensis]